MLGMQTMNKFCRRELSLIWLREMFGIYRVQKGKERMRITPRGEWQSDREVRKSAGCTPYELLPLSRATPHSNTSSILFGIFREGYINHPFLLSVSTPSSYISLSSCRYYSIYITAPMFHVEGRYLAVFHHRYLKLVQY